MHPFDIRSVVLAKHAQHVVIIHFPITLFIVGVAFDLLGIFRRNKMLQTAGYYNLSVAALTAPLAVATGILAWQLQLNAQRLHGIILLHLILGTMSALLICLVWWLQFKATRAQTTSPSYIATLEIVAVAVVAITGHLGGFVSGVNTSG